MSLIVGAPGAVVSIGFSVRLAAGLVLPAASVSVADTERFSEPLNAFAVATYESRPPELLTLKSAARSLADSATPFTETVTFAPVVTEKPESKVAPGAALASAMSVSVGAPGAVVSTMKP